MENSTLASYALFIVDLFICVYFYFFIVGVKNGKVYFMGSSYSKEQQKSQYVQSMIGYLLLLLTSLWIRFFIFPEYLYSFLLHE